jgi:cathepsin H
VRVLTPGPAQFSMTGAVESPNLIATKTSVLASEQQLIDCAGAFDNHGCDGGLPSQAFEYVLAAGGIETEADYPYRAPTGKKCLFDASKVAIKLTGKYNLTEGAEHELVQWIGLHQPVSVAFEVVHDFQFYKSGVYASNKCKSGPNDVNHAVLAVGYNVTSGIPAPFYIIKNSWGADWGMDGYFEMAYGRNMCGVATCASVPFVAGGDARGEPTEP